MLRSEHGLEMSVGSFSVCPAKRESSLVLCRTSFLGLLHVVKPFGIISRASSDIIFAVMADTSDSVSSDVTALFSVNS